MHVDAKRTMLTTLLGAFFIVLILFAKGEYQNAVRNIYCTLPKASRTDQEPNVATGLPYACHAIFVQPNMTCPRFLINEIDKSGFGHQFSDVVMGIWKAKMNGFSYVFEPFVGTNMFKEDYSFVNELIGISALFERLGAATRASIDQHKLELNWLSYPRTNITSKEAKECKTVYAIKSYGHCPSARSNNCFLAPEFAFAFQRMSSCLRQVTEMYGTAFDQCILVNDQLTHSTAREKSTVQNLPTDTVYVVWHLRVGDFVSHRPEDPFFAHVSRAIKEITEGYNVSVTLVGGGDRSGSGQRVPQDYVDVISKTIALIWSDSRIPDIVAPAYSFREAFLAMMQADVLIGSGSSLPTIASLVSARPLYFHHVPKHGFNYGMELMADNVDLAFNGTVHDSLRRLKVEMKYRKDLAQGKGCRRAIVQASPKL